MITLADPIAHARRCFGDRIAVIDGERASWTMPSSPNGATASPPAW